METKFSSSLFWVQPWWKARKKNNRVKSAPVNAKFSRQMAGTGDNKCVTVLKSTEIFSAYFDNVYLESPANPTCLQNFSKAP